MYLTLYSKLFPGLINDKKTVPTLEQLLEVREIPFRVATPEQKETWIFYHSKLLPIVSQGWQKLIPADIKDDSDMHVFASLSDEAFTCWSVAVYRQATIDGTKIKKGSKPAKQQAHLYDAITERMKTIRVHPNAAMWICEAAVYHVTKKKESRKRKRVSKQQASKAVGSVGGKKRNLSNFSSGLTLPAGMGMDFKTTAEI